MKNLFLPYELSKTLKRKGFNEPCIAYKWDDTYIHSQGIVANFENFHWTIRDLHNHNESPTRISIPLYQQVIDWFRIEHKLFVSVEIGTQEYSYFIYDIRRNESATGTKSLSYNGEYYEAMDKAIEEALRLI